MAIINKILNKWYFALIIIPILVTALIEKNTFIINEWKNILIATLIIVIIVLIIELNKKNKKINNNDIKTLSKLLKQFNIESFEEDIATQFSSHGYPISSIRNLIKFAQESKKIENTFQNKQLQKLIMELSEKTDIFLDYSSSVMFNDRNFYEIPIELKRTAPNKRKEIARKIDNYADDIYSEIKKIIKFMKKYDINY